MKEGKLSTFYVFSTPPSILAEVKGGQGAEKLLLNVKEKCSQKIPESEQLFEKYLTSKVKGA